MEIIINSIKADDNWSSLNIVDDIPTEKSFHSESFVFEKKRKKKKYVSLFFSRERVNNNG